MSSQIIYLKYCTDLQDSNRILASETVRVWAAAPGIRSSGLGSAAIFSKHLHGRWPSWGDKARIGRDLFFRSEDDRPAAKPATPLLSLRWTFRVDDGEDADDEAAHEEQRRLARKQPGRERANPREIHYGTSPWRTICTFFPFSVESHIARRHRGSKAA
jgi:hypothetical protein